MSDVLAITVPISGAYASVNNVGRNSHRAGKKSAAYHTLFAAVKEAAEAEIARTGWTTATSNCLAIIVRYVPDNRRADALNMGKCEWDALTAAGVWDDDRWANPSLPWIVPCAGGHRIAIVVVKVGAPQQRQKEALQPFSAYEAHAAHVRYAIREFDRASKRAESVPGCCADDEPPACSKGGKSGVVVTAPRRTEAGASAAPQTVVDKRAGLRRWRPGDPIPVGYAACNGRLVPLADALEMIGK